MEPSRTSATTIDVAVVGAGVAGLAAAYQLSKDPRVRLTIYEERTQLGGHANTVMVRYSALPLTTSSEAAATCEAMTSTWKCALLSRWY